MKIHTKIFIIIILLSFQTTLYAQQTSFDRFSDHFELKAFGSLHVYLPISYVYDFHVLDPYPYKGKKLDNALMKAVGKQVSADNNAYYAVFKFYISKDFTAFIVREGGECQFFISSLELYIYDQKNKKCVQNITLAGYSHGESGGFFCASWIEDINGDQCLDLITRGRQGSWEELEYGGKDSITVYLWQNSQYEKYTPVNIKKFLAAYPIFHNPFSSSGIELEDIDKDLKQAENVYAIILSSDKSFEAARFEETRFEKEYTFHNSIFYYFSFLSCNIYEKNHKFYTTIGGYLSRNEAELILLDIKKSFPTAWIIDWREWCREQHYNEEGYWECVQ
jgi:hypothetical protein